MALFAAVVVASSPAGAQGLLEGLFGLLTPKPQPRAPAWSPRQGPDFGDFRANPFDSRRGEPSRFGGGRYKTMCVRLCDGFYFPIGNATPRRAFWRDAEMCRSRCDSETQLFYMPTAAGSIEEARSLTGLAYADLQNAYRYRKALDNSCTCRPEPWSASERARHAQYAMVEAGTTDPDSDEAVARGDGVSPVPAAGRESVMIDGRATVRAPDEERPPVEPALVAGPLVAGVRPAQVRLSPAKPAGSNFGLGGPFGRSGQAGFQAGSHASFRPVRKKPSFKSHWPGMEGN